MSKTASGARKRRLRLMRAEGIHPTLVTYNTMLMGASAERDWEAVATRSASCGRSGQARGRHHADCLCGIEKLQAAADARAGRGGSAVGAAAAEGADADGAVLEHAVRQVGARARRGLHRPGDLCERLREVVAEETERRRHQPARAPRRARCALASRRRLSPRNVQGRGPSADAARRVHATHAYDALLRALHVSERGADVESRVRGDADGGARRTVHTYNSLIASYKARRQWQRAGDAMARMQEEGIAPDAITFDALIDVAEETGIDLRHGVAGAGAGGGPPAMRG